MDRTRDPTHQAVECLRTGRFAEARRRALSILEQNPESVRAWVISVYAEFCLGRKEVMEMLFELMFQSFDRETCLKTLIDLLEEIRATNQLRLARQFHLEEFEMPRLHQEMGRQM